MTKLRILIFLLTIVIVGGVGFFAALFARGYRFDIGKFKFIPSGLLVVKSDPDGASVFINGDLKTATDSTLSLAPGTYDVEIRRDGFFPWSKRLKVEKEVVTEAKVALFRIVPSLSAVTFSGATNPVSSPDASKIAYVDKTGLWVLDTFNLPFGFPKDPRRITDGDLTGATYEFSPNGREVLLTAKGGVSLLDTGTFIPQAQRVNVFLRKDEIKSLWEDEREAKLATQMRNLPGEVVDILTRKASGVSFSPDESMVLYTASAGGVLADNLIHPLPGASTQKQERSIKEGQTYVYDIREDRNFLVEENSGKLEIAPERRLSWFPTSRHLILAEEGKITIMDYDRTNRQVVYSGSYVAPFAFPFANTGKLLILTNLGGNTSVPNLYSLSLK